MTLGIAGEAHFPFAYLKEVLEKNGRNPKVFEDGLRWETPMGESRVWFKSANVKTLDGFDIAGYLQYDLKMEEARNEPVESIAAWNSVASTSAILTARNGEPPMLLSRAAIFEGDESMVNRFFVPFVGTECLLQPNLFLGVATNDKEGFPNAFGLAYPDMEVPYGEDDFEAATEILTQMGCYSNFAQNGLTSEVAWDAGSVSATVNLFNPEYAGDRRTSLLKIVSSERHPFLGNGLLMTLHLPLSFPNQSHAAEVASVLNHFEADAADMPPFFGAWCAGRPNTVTYTCFIPVELCYPGFVSNLAVWSAHRGKMIPKALPEIEALAAG